jgi:hypothetical protein
MSTEKIEAFWVNATAFDVARVMAGETVEARFKDSTLCQWTDSELAGVKINSDGNARWIGLAESWAFCQVYREPAWWLDKPNPGPVYRLLGKMPDEAKLATDEAWSGTRWLPIAEDNGIQRDCVWYRRRIEAVEPDRGIALSVGDVVHHPNGLLLTITAKGFEVSQ